MALNIRLTNNSGTASMRVDAGNLHATVAPGGMQDVTAGAGCDVSGNPDFAVENLSADDTFKVDSGHTHDTLPPGATHSYSGAAKYSIKA